MRNVRDIVKGFMRDETVRERKPADLSKLPTDPPKQAAPKPEPRVPHVTPTVYGKPAAPPTPIPYRDRQEEPTFDVLEPDCEHQWQWKDGVKSCWRCGGRAPLDKRDKSTSWQSRVYGKKT